MLSGVSAKLKDKRVDNILVRLGYDISECEIFYSPITGVLFYAALFFASLLPFSLYLFYLFYMMPIYVVIYFTFVYLFQAWFNNSFSVVQNKLIIINPNFPFRKTTVYDLSKIEKITIDNSAILTISWIFFVLGSNNIKIYSDNKSSRFYCTYLQLDAFDENITEKTMDDFHSTLNSHNVFVEFNLENK